MSSKYKPTTKCDSATKIILQLFCVLMLHGGDSGPWLPHQSFGGKSLQRAETQTDKRAQVGQVLFTFATCWTICVDLSHLASLSLLGGGCISQTCLMCNNGQLDQKTRADFDFSNLRINTKHSDAHGMETTPQMVQFFPDLSI